MYIYVYIIDISPQTLPQIHRFAFHIDELNKCMANNQFGKSR